MNLFDLFIKIGVDDQASSKVGNISQKLGNGLKTAAKVGTAAVAAAGTAVVALVKQSTEAYADYEQLVGGVDTLFKDSSKKVQGYAEQAYKTAGLSANEYMSTVTSFSASLLQSLGGDTEKTAEVANRAVTDMSDNANKMGTSMESIVQTYQSLSRGNFAMLDNLKLGYGGTKAELERLIEDASKMTDVQNDLNLTVKNGDMSFANIVNAISVVQKEMGIMGTTAKEASTTIQGSVASMKGAWENLLVSFTSENMSVEDNISQFVETVETTAKNLLPVIETSLQGVDNLINGLIPVIIEKIPTYIQEYLPMLVETASTLISSLATGLTENQDVIFDTILQVINSVVELFTTQLPVIFELGLNLIIALAEGIADNLDTIIPAVIQAILTIVQTLTSAENIERLITAAFTLIGELAKGMLKAIFTTDWGEVANNVISGIWNGLKNGWENIKKWFKNAWKGLIDDSNKQLDIHSPSRVFAKMGKNSALGYGVGWLDTFSDVEDDVLDSLDFDNVNYGYQTATTTTIERNGSGESSYNSQKVDVTIGIEDSGNALGLARALLPFLKIAEKEVYA